MLQWSYQRYSFKGVWDMRHIGAPEMREVIVYYNFIERVCIFYLLIKINCLTWRGSRLEYLWHSRAWFFRKSMNIILTMLLKKGLGWSKNQIMKTFLHHKN